MKCSFGKRSGGFALVLVLGFVVLMTIVILAFFSRSILQRQISGSSANQTKVNLFTQGALDIIIGDLKQEIVDGSTATTDNGVVVYVPKPTFNSGGLGRHKYATAVPDYQGFTPVFNTSFQETDGLNNLYKVSAATAFYTNSVTGIRRGTADSTTNASANGRSISTARWNKPLLLAQQTPASTTDFTPVVAFKVPTWILVSRNGSNPTAWNNNLRASSINTTSVMGRYAYAIYNEGGVLDVNVAGFPSAVPADFKSKRGVMPQVDLAAIPGVTDANALVLWRNRTTAQTASTYTNSVLTSTNGFAAVTAGDQTFVSRQALIKYAQDHPAQIKPQALQYLGTFSRELNAPSYTPPQIGSPARPRTLSGQGYRSGGLGDMDDLFNPSLINTRVGSAFTRQDSTLANPGEPLIKSRFPLSRLAWVGRNGPSGATAQQVEDSFGLTYGGGAWTYNHGDPGRILRLSEAASAGREPDFFELLQAGIFVGSLAKSGPTQGGIQTGANTLLFDSNSWYQLMQIGANLIDQADADSYPTRISFNGEEFDGVENLPGIHTVFKGIYRFDTSNGTDPTHKKVGFWYVPIIWNAHADAKTYYKGASYVGPSKFRFICTVAPGDKVCFALTKVITLFDPLNIALGMSPSGYTTFANPNGLTFSLQDAFAQPTVLTPDNASATGNDLIDDPGKEKFLGICVGIADIPDNRVDPTVDPAEVYNYGADFPTVYVTHALQYQEENGTWVTYNRFKNDSNSYWTTNQAPAFTVYAPRTYTLRNGLDARTDRFGGSVGRTEEGGPPPGFSFPSYNFTTKTWYTDTFRPSGTYIQNGVSLGNPHGSGWVSNGTAAFFGMLSDNKTYATDPNGVSMYYYDPDGQLRKADGAYVNATAISGVNPTAGQLNNTASNGGTPLAMDQGAVDGNTPFGSYNSRPVILNRAFRSVAEMGYASRDTPWKNLDFFTAESADAALLDLFCVNESPLVAAGKLDLNTRQQPVIEAVLNGILKSEPDLMTITAAEATLLATNFMALKNNPAMTVAAASGLNDNLTDPVTSSGNAITGPILNRSQLVSRWQPKQTVAAYSNGADFTIKRRREAALRALADISNTRTWNLLIDVIAQTGRYNATASSLDQFTVESERRVWLHVAIDRYTGKVIAQNLEPVYE